MKVSNLLELLKELDPNLTVVLSSDGEGNTFSPLAGFDAQYIYVPESTWSGALYELEEDETLEEFQQAEANAERVVVLYPTN